MLQWGTIQNSSKGGVRMKNLDSCTRLQWRFALWMLREISESSGPLRLICMAPSRRSALHFFFLSPFVFILNGESVVRRRRDLFDQVNLWLIVLQSVYRIVCPSIILRYGVIFVRFFFLSLKLLHPVIWLSDYSLSRRENNSKSNEKFDGCFVAEGRYWLPMKTLSSPINSKR